MSSSKTPVNIPFVAFTKRVLAAGKLSAKGYILLFVYYLKLILVMPGALLQYLLYANKINKTSIDKDPVFIIGHYRSGTTYLHKLMAADERFGYISYYDIICPNTSLLFGKWLQQVLQIIIDWLEIKTAFFNNVIPLLEEPAEEERFLINKASAYTDYWRFVFPLNWSEWQSCSQLSKNKAYYQRWKKEYLYVLKLATYKHKGKQLLLKSPPNTERIQYLLQLFPNAKFIYISRNPYHLFYSMRNLWHKAIARFCLQSVTDEQIENIVFEHYAHLMEQYEKDKALIPAGNLVEIQYENLEANAQQVLQTIYETLQLPHFEALYKRLITKLQMEKLYRKFEYEYSKETFEKIEKHWAKYICQWRQQSFGVAADTDVLN